MPETIFSRDVAMACTLYLAVLAGVLGWLFGSRQNILARSLFNAICVSVRLGLVFGLFFCVGWFASIATWLVMVVVIALIIVGIIVDLPVSGFVGFAILAIAQQFVLGFPARYEWKLSQSTIATVAGSDPPQRRDLIGCKGIVVSPLRPVGEIKVGDEKYRAKSSNGQMMVVGEQAVVVAVHQGTLLIRAHGESPTHTEEPPGSQN